MANLYRVCSGNTTQVITVTLNTSASCSFWRTVWLNGYNNRYYRKLLSVTLSQAAAQAFNYYYYDYYTTTKNSGNYNTGQALRSVSIPAGVTSHEWYIGCKEEVGQDNGDDPIDRDFREEI